ncbi:hypothetical protein FACS1894205_5690 [Alphaproteobacteria bacterium]|nr:hypothetical protein FACS1894205_5690 [Alphaproteobacteria bacterium]
MHFSLVEIAQPRGGIVRFFDDVMLPLSFAFRRLGYDVEFLRNEINPDSVNILFGVHNNPLLPEFDLPPNTVIFNLEQLSSNNARFSSNDYLAQLSRNEVWDYSRRNMDYLTSQGVAARYLQLGYVPEMTRFAPNVTETEDVLFYGLVSPRRQRIFDELAASGVMVNPLPVGSFGRQRDIAIATSRLVLNIHHYLPASLEIVRLGYLWANRKAVVSELRPDTEFYPGLEDACAFCDYENMAPTVRDLLADEQKRKKQAAAGFEAFSALSLEKSLEELVGRRQVYKTGAEFKTPRPDHLHVGSGRDFRNEALNIDISSLCNPDLVLDISKPLDANARRQTERFGEISLAPGSFSKITAFEVLEHVHDLQQTMRNFLNLLKMGGELIVSVPYDLSCGAWQDPTHVRGFNERSWDYYTNDAWYLGWRDERFELVDLSFILSSIGRNMIHGDGGWPLACRTPRAVDGMRVILRKCESTKEDKFLHDRMNRTIYNKTSIVWEVFDDRDDVLEKHLVHPERSKSQRSSVLKLFKVTLFYYLFKFLKPLGVGERQRRFFKDERKFIRTKMK